MAKKSNVNMDDVMKKYGPALKKFGDEAAEVAKKGEEGFVMMSKLLKIQLDLAGMTIQREKLYYEIGKKVADKLMKGSLNIEGFEKYKKQLAKIQSEGEKKKRAISRVKKTGGKKSKSSKK